MKTLKLSHFSTRKVRDLVSSEEPLGIHFKPRNCLWLSCGDAWIDWLRYEGMTTMLDRVKYRHDTAVPLASLFVLSTLAEVDAITRRFGRRIGNAVVIDWDAVRGSNNEKAGVLMTECAAAPSGTRGRSTAGT